MEEQLNTNTHGFDEPSLSSGDVERLCQTARLVRGDILAMTTLAGTGHLGGSLSSADIFLVLWSYANVGSATVDDPGRDRIVVSHGHTAPAVYAVLGRLGYFEPEQAICGFRVPGGPFEGHADPKVPGVEWACGNLGQGLSAACGMALSARLTGHDYRTFCVMGDGEQQKGQIAEARRFAVMHSLTNLIAIIDCNGLQATGSVPETMRQDLHGEWTSAGWRVIDADGHDYADLYEACSLACRSNDAPTVILARTTMGKGVEWIEDQYEYHGKTLTRDECASALAGLGLPSHSLELARSRSCTCPVQKREPIENRVCVGVPQTYTGRMDCRSAFGSALVDIAVGNPDVPVAVFDCDLSISVKTDGLAAVRPEGLFQCGIQEHSAASIAGAASKSGVLSFYAEFGVFGLDETYNQHRLNDINDTSLKLICTHCGLDVGEDGKTHQCIDYISLAANLYGFKLIIPADANQADRATRYIASTPGRFILAMGRSKMPIIADDDGTPLFGGDCRFEYGRSDLVRLGSDGTIVTLGNMVSRALIVRERLLEAGVDLGILNASCPLDIEPAALDMAAGTGLVVTYEDHNARTGLGSVVAQYLAGSGRACRFLRFGVTRYGVSGSPEENYRMQGLDPDSVAQAILEHMHGGTRS